MRLLICTRRSIQVIVICGQREKAERQASGRRIENYIIEILSVLYRVLNADEESVLLDSRRILEDGKIIVEVKDLDVLIRAGEDVYFPLEVIAGQLFQVDFPEDEIAQALFAPAQVHLEYVAQVVGRVKGNYEDAIFFR